MAIVKIQHRRGAYTDYDPTKLLPGEMAVVQSGDPNSTDGKAVYIATAAGNVKRLATAEELQSEIETALQEAIPEAISEATQDAEAAADRAETAASTFVIDKTLSVSDRPADAKVVGDEVTNVKNDLNSLYQIDNDYVTEDCSSQTTTADSGTAGGVTWTKNGNADWTAVGTATGSGSFKNLIGMSTRVLERFYGGQKLNININSTDSNLVLSVVIYSSTQDTKVLDLGSGSHYITLPSDITGIIIRTMVRTGNSVNGRIIFSITGYYSRYVASTNDTSDRSAFINKMLTYTKSVILAPGIFYVNKLELPDNSTLYGCGNNTVLRLLDNGEYAVNLNSRCNISNLRIIGADNDITLPPSDYEPKEGTTDYTEGLTWDERDGYIRSIFDTAVLPGKYILKINVASNKNDDVYVWFLDQTAYSTSHVIASAIVPNGEYIEIIITPETSIKSVYITAASTVGASVGYSVTLNSIELHTIGTLIGSRNGIVWKTPDKCTSTINNCVIERFNGAGILAKDTSTPVDNNLIISNCFIRNNNAGIYIQRNSEFIKICNSTIVHNWYGVLNRGGNNNISNCGLDANIVGVQVDADEGANNGHGTITGCSINHSDSNNGYGLIIKNTGREVISNCNFYYSKIRLDHTNGNVITGCGFGSRTGWEIIGGNCNIFNGCMVRSATDTPITIENNTSTKIINCFTRNGDAVTAPSN